MSAMEYYYYSVNNLHNNNLSEITVHVLISPIINRVLGFFFLLIQIVEN